MGALRLTYQNRGNFYLSSKKSVSDGCSSLELSNHLGNVLSVISDKVIPHPSGGSVAYYKADILQAMDYSPFGVTLHGRNLKRSGLTEDFRFGFQGQEMDDEVKGEGNSVNYTFRMHDPRLGRFFAIDPLIEEYPSYSSYSFSGNKPIAFIEMEGAEELNATNLGPANNQFKPAFRLALPDGSFATIWQVHGSYAVTQTDRNNIESFNAQGYNTDVKNNYDYKFVRDNGTTVNIQAGVGGVSRQTEGPNGVMVWSLELFRVNSIQAPSQLTINPQQQLQQNVVGQVAQNNNQWSPAPLTSNANLANGAQIQANNINNAINNLIASAPAGAIVNNFQVSVGINQNLSPAQQTLVRNTIIANVNPNAIVNFTPYVPINANDNATITDNTSVTATQTGPAVNQQTLTPWPATTPPPPLN